MMDWYKIADVGRIDSPVLLVYPARIRANIRLLKEMVSGNTARLRPHVKTHKMVEVSRMMLAEGIQQFKCSTIAEAEMLAMSGAPDVLMAYQPVGPKVERWFQLITAYPDTHFSCLVDHVDAIKALGAIGQAKNSKLSVYLDLDVGMGRTGAPLERVSSLWTEIRLHSDLILEGLHAYDGHIHAADPAVRKIESDASYAMLLEAYNLLQPLCKQGLKMVIGGSPSFTSHALRDDVTCSPGTFVFWDWGYRQRIAEQAFEYAAVLLTRVISVIDETHICVDLGYKAVASDPPLPRVLFLNAPDAIPAFQSEEHLVLTVSNSEHYPLGTPLYAVPTHICPTVALYDRVQVIADNQQRETWHVVARNRMLNF